MAAACLLLRFTLAMRVSVRIHGQVGGELKWRRYVCSDVVVYIPADRSWPISTSATLLPSSGTT